MAALTTQNNATPAAVTTAAATGGGDTIEAGYMSGGMGAPVFLRAVVGGTATTITVGGVAYGPYTSVTVDIPIANTYAGSRLAVTYSQVTSVTVGSVASRRGSDRGHGGDMSETLNAGGYTLVPDQGWVLEDAPPMAVEKAEETEEVTEETEEEATRDTRAYEDRTRIELVKLAQDRGVKGAAQMRKEELIEALRG